MRRPLPAARVGAAVALGALILAGAPDRALAFRCLRAAPDAGPSLTWPARTVEWWLDGRLVSRGPAGAADQVEASFAAWVEPACSDFAFRRVGLVTQTALEPGNGRTEVVYAEVWPHNPSALALTTTLFEPSTGIVREADIELNAEHFEFAVLDGRSCSATTLADLANTLTHEVGHLLGLAHPPAVERFATSTMFARSPPCETRKRSLEDDDVEGLCAIYPRDAPTQPCFSSSEPALVVVDRGAGFDEVGCRGAGAPGVSALGLLLAGLGLSRRRRRP